MAHITLIDDEPEILTMLERSISKRGEHTVRTFSNPIEALNHIHKSDLVFLDVMMPQINGLDLLPKLMEKNPDLKVIMMTAYSTLDTVLKSHRNGAVNYIMKPFDSLESVYKKIGIAID